jgi:hypothetical protein
MYMVPAIIMLGICLLVCGIFWPNMADRRSGWSNADSQKFAHVSATLHAAAHLGNASNEEMKELQSEFDRLKIKLEHAQNEPQRWSRILLWSGAALAGVGVVMHLAQRKE